MILNVFGDAVYLVLRLMHSDLRVGCRNRIYLSVDLFLLEYRPLSHADSKLDGMRCTLLSVDEV